MFSAAEGYSLADRPSIIHIADNTAISYISTGLYKNYYHKRKLDQDLYPDTPAIISSKVAAIFANITTVPIVFHVRDKLRLLNQTEWI